MCLCIIGTDWNSMIMSMSKLYHPDCILTAVTCIVSGQWCSFEQNALRPLNFLNKCHCKDLVRCTLSCLFFISSAAFDIWNVFAHLLLFKCRTSCAKHSFLCAPTQMYNLSWLFVLWWFYCRWLYCQAVFECPNFASIALHFAFTTQNTLQSPLMKPDSPPYYFRLLSVFA